MWNSNDLREDLILLNEMQKKENDINMREYYSLIIGAIYDNIVDLESDSSVIEEPNYENTIRDFSTCNLYYPYIKKYQDLYLKNSISNDKYIYHRKNYKINKKDTFELIDNFYKSFDKEIYNHFKTVLNNCKINYYKNNDINDGEIISVPILGKNYIGIAKKRDIREEVVSLTHELGHATILDMNKKRYYYDKFTEIESFFFELLGCDFFAKELNDKFFIEEKKGYLSYNFELAEGILNTKSLILRLFKENSKISSKKFDKIMKQDSEYLSLDIDLDVTYLFSYIVAIELYENYLIDKDKALQKLINITSNSNEKSEYERILNNVTPCKTLTKNFDRYKKKQSEIK